jgi:HK97 family phage major capsid protein
VSEDIEKVGLDESATTEIATKTADQVVAAFTPKTDPAITALSAEIAELKALLTTPNRPERETPGVQAKGSESVYMGGDDAYTYAGVDDADRATTLFVVSTLLSGNGKAMSARGREVMTRAAEAALKAQAAPYKADLFVKSTHAALRGEAYKAMTSTGSNVGDDWVPTFASSELWRDVHLATEIAGQVRRIEMPTNPYDVPTATADPTFYYASTENTAVTGGNVATSKATLTAKKIQADVTFSGELTEDSIIPVAPEIRAALVRRAAQTIDDLIIHGDTETGGTGNVNYHDSAPAGGSFYLALDGMRKFCGITNTGQVQNFSGAFTTANFVATRALLGKYGARSSDLLFVMGQSLQNSIGGVAEYLTMEKYGANATIVAGEVGRIFNIPIFLSEAIPGTSTDKVDDDGFYTAASPATNDTDGWFVLANKSQWITGFRRGVQIESFRDVQKDANILVCSFRMALIPSGIATTHTAYGINLTV